MKICNINFNFCFQITFGSVIVVLLSSSISSSHAFPDFNSDLEEQGFLYRDVYLVAPHPLNPAQYNSYAWKGE